MPDNLKSAVTKACRYELLLNRSYQELLEHYGTAALPPAQPNPAIKPKSKSACKSSSAGYWHVCANAPSSLADVNAAPNLP
ncbi:MAG: hypothetical protein U0Y68_15715 [Blastocatellia bacterium]